MILFWVQHLLGIGHMARAALLVEAMRARGLPVTVVQGGADAPVRFAAPVRRLTPVRATDQTFRTLVSPHGPVSPALWDRRREELAAVVRELRPALVLIEAWPFGRRPFSHELEPLLDGPAPVVVSVRDILHSGRKPGRAEEAAARADRAALLLVHADPALARLADTFPLADTLAVRVEHTGLVAPAGPLVPLRDAQVVVSAGGGAFGAPLMRAAVEAARRLPRSVLLATGRNMAEAEREALRASAPPNVRIEAHVSDLAARMAGAAVSVSQAGYNTAVDVLRAQAHGTRAVFVPSDVDGQNEQATRARLLARAGRATVLPESQLTPEALAEAIAAAPAPALNPMDMPVNMDGAARSAALVEELL